MKSVFSKLGFRKMDEMGDDEYKDSTPILKIIVVGVIVAAIIISIGAWIVFSGI